jgi:hypothetical protein
MIDKSGFRRSARLPGVVAGEPTAEREQSGGRVPWDTSTEITDEAWEAIRRGAPAGVREPRRR